MHTSDLERQTIINTPVESSGDNVCRNHETSNNKCAHVIVVLTVIIGIEYTANKHSYIHICGEHKIPWSIIENIIITGVI